MRDHQRGEALLAHPWSLPLHVAPFNPPWHMGTLLKSNERTSPHLHPHRPSAADSRITSAPTSTIPGEGGPDTTHAGVTGTRAPGIVAAPTTSRVHIPAQQQHHHHRRHLETPALPTPPSARESTPVPPRPSHARPPPCLRDRGRHQPPVPSRTPQVHGKERRRLLHTASRPYLGVREAH